MLAGAFIAVPLNFTFKSIFQKLLSSSLKPKSSPSGRRGEDKNPRTQALMSPLYLEKGEESEQMTDL